MILIIKSILFLLCMSVLLYFLGSFFLRHIGIQTVGVTSPIVYGFVVMLSLFEIISFPFLVLKNFFSVLYYIFLVVLLCIVLFSVYESIKLGGFKGKKTLLQWFEGRNIWKALFLITVFIQIFITSYLHFNCYDDGYYLAISNAAIEQDIIELNDMVAYSGNYFFANLYARPSIQSWEVLIAFFSKLFCIHPTILAHSILPVLLLPIYYMAAKEVFKRVTQNNAEIYLCMFVYALLHMFYGNGYFVTAYLTVGTWMGKSLLFGVILPLILSVCLDVYHARISNVDCHKLWHLSVAGISLTATGIYIVPMYCFILGLPYLIKVAISQDWKYMGKVIKSVFLSLSGLILVGVYAIIAMLSRWSLYTNTLSFNWKRANKLAFDVNKILVFLFAVSLLLILIYEKEKERKLLFIGAVIVTMVIFWNPWSANFLALHVTGASVYWRTILLLPVSFVIPMGVIHAGRLKIGRIIPTLIVVGSVIYNGVMASNGMLAIYSEHQNAYMIPEEVLEVCKKFDLSEQKKIVLLAEEPINKFFRQYSSWFDVVVGRNDSVVMDELGTKYFEMVEDVFTNRYIDEGTCNNLELFQVEYIVFQGELEATCGYELYDETDAFKIYKKID